MTGIDTPLRRLRLASGLTQAQLAVASGVNPRQIQRIELGTSKAENLTLKNAVALASALGVKPEDLMEEKKMRRFAYHGHPGQHPDEMWLSTLTDEELAKEIRRLNEWDADLLYDLCWRADMQEEYDAAGDDFEIRRVCRRRKARCGNLRATRPPTYGRDYFAIIGGQSTKRRFSALT